MANRQSRTVTMYFSGEWTSKDNVQYVETQSYQRVPAIMKQLYSQEVGNIKNSLGRFQPVLPNMQQLQTNSQQNQPQVQPVQTNKQQQQHQPQIEEVQTIGQQNQPQMEQAQTNRQQNRPYMHQVQTNRQQNQPQMQPVQTHRQQNQPQMQQVQTHRQHNQPQMQQVQTHRQQNQPQMKQVQTHMQLTQPQMEQIQTQRQAQTNRQQLNSNRQQLRPSMQQIQSNMQQVQQNGPLQVNAQQFQPRWQQLQQQQQQQPPPPHPQGPGVVPSSCGTPILASLSQNQMAQISHKNSQVLTAENTTSVQQFQYSNFPACSKLSNYSTAGSAPPPYAQVQTANVKQLNVPIEKLKVLPNAWLINNEVSNVRSINPNISNSSYSDNSIRYHCNNVLDMSRTAIPLKSRLKKLQNATPILFSKGKQKNCLETPLIAMNQPQIRVKSPQSLNKVDINQINHIHPLTSVQDFPNSSVENFGANPASNSSRSQNPEPDPDSDLLIIEDLFLGKNNYNALEKVTKLIKETLKKQLISEVKNSCLEKKSDLGSRKDVEENGGIKNHDLGPSTSQKPSRETAEKTDSTGSALQENISRGVVSEMLSGDKENPAVSQTAVADPCASSTAAILNIARTSCFAATQSVSSKSVPNLKISFHVTPPNGQDNDMLTNRQDRSMLMRNPCGSMATKNKPYPELTTQSILQEYYESLSKPTEKPAEHSEKSTQVTDEQSDLLPEAASTSTSVSTLKTGLDLDRFLIESIANRTMKRIPPNITVDMQPTDATDSIVKKKLGPKSKTMFRIFSSKNSSTGAASSDPQSQQENEDQNTLSEATLSGAKYAKPGPKSRTVPFDERLSFHQLKTTKSTIEGDTERRKKLDVLFDFVENGNVNLEMPKTNLEYTKVCGIKRKFHEVKFLHNGQRCKRKRTNKCAENHKTMVTEKVKEKNFLKDPNILVGSLTCLETVKDSHIVRLCSKSSLPEKDTTFTEADSSIGDDIVKNEILTNEKGMPPSKPQSPNGIQISSTTAEDITNENSFKALKAKENHRCLKCAKTLPTGSFWVNVLTCELKCVYCLRCPQPNDQVFELFNRVKDLEKELECLRREEGRRKLSINKMDWDERRAPEKVAPSELIHRTENLFKILLSDSEGEE